MQILALDTSTDSSVVALVRDGRTIAEGAGSAAGEAAPRHGDVLLPKIAAVLAAAGTELAAVDLIAVGLGPGSFTGLRVGLATAKGLALGSGIPLRGVGTTLALAQGAFERALQAPPDQVFVVLDAGRGELYAAGFAGAAAGLTVVLAGARAPAAELIARVAESARGSVLLCGSGVRSHAEALRAALTGRTVQLAEPRFDLPDGGDLAAVATTAYAAGGPSDLGSLEPVYLRDSDAKLPARPLSLG